MIRLNLRRNARRLRHFVKNPLPRLSMSGSTRTLLVIGGTYFRMSSGIMGRAEARPSESKVALLSLQAIDLHKCDSCRITLATHDRSVIAGIERSDNC